MFGRALGFGDLKILTASDAAISEFQMIQRPIEFKKAMLEAKHEYEVEVAGGTPAPTPPLRSAPLPGSAGVAAAPAPAAPVGDDTVHGAMGGGTSAPLAGSVPPPDQMDADDVTRTLNSLADLRDRGAISPEEYERKKAELLSRL